ncbi:hypothetical protein PQR14_22085 [Paraburkholderia bryophila]|uniref:hypothetical protein n=1 Tax=Paraburkholderia bryophila TaxID=420952 RepID=UPI0038B9A7DB
MGLDTVFSSAYANTRPRQKPNSHNGDPENSMRDGEEAMKLSHRLANSDNAGPAWGLALGIFMTIVGTGLWFHATSSAPPERLDASLAVGVVLIGVLLAVYATREVRHQRKRR